ncbi:hypothetical protein CH063_03044, partial [Colletotrichum higginsianum]
ISFLATRLENEGTYVHSPLPNTRYVPRIALLRTSFKTHSHNGDMDRQDIAHVGLSCHSASLHGRAFPS